MKNKNLKGFTLIELLVVIAIIAILATVVILSLNPAELLRQSRDSNRVSDMATMKSAIALYLADVSSPNLAPTTSTNCSASGYQCMYFSQSLTGFGALTTASSGFLITGSFQAASTSATTSRAINGTGWIPVNFTNISSGAPIGSLPVDPTNATTTDAFGNPLIYGYAATTTNLGFKMTTHMESSKFRTGGGADVETPDGGNSTSTYEQGSSLTL